MADSPTYRPIAPPKAERRRSEFRQALRLPKTLRSIYRIVREDFETGVLDEYLWLKTIPLRTLTIVFDTTSRIRELAAFAPSPERQAQIDEALRSGREKRVRLDRWQPKQKALAMEQRRFEEAHQDVIAQAIAVECGGFNGAETAGSEREKEIRRRIRRVTSGRKMLQTCRLNRLREYQVRNNHHVVASESRALTM